jgi:hypothetical protein
MKETDGASDLMEAVRFVASCVDLYNVMDERLEIAHQHDELLAFFSRRFLQANGWSVIPLWEGDLRRLLREDGTLIPFLALIRARCLDTGGQFLHVAAVERTSLVTGHGATALAIGSRKFDLVKQDPAAMFETTQTNVPHWGNNFLWPSNKRFAIYTNGDQAAFVAGNRMEMLDLIGVSFDYCVRRITEGHAHNKDWPVMKAWINFCYEFLG